MNAPAVRAFSTEDLESTPPSRESVISLQGVRKTFHSSDGGAVEVIRDITLDIKKEEFVSIVGPSGCGKSTMFNIISSLLEPTDGVIELSGRDPQCGARIGYMLQRDLLFPWRTIIDNVCLGLEVRGVSKSRRYEMAKDHLSRYGLADFADQYPGTLSGGMRQRVALIRTLITEPDLILLDEPFSALDYQTRLVLEEEIVSILKEHKKTVVLITHDIGEAIAMSDRVAVMTKRPTSVKKVYDVGLSRELGSCLKARSDVRYQTLFDQIWEDLDIQVAGGAA
ncbi:MULTISPECIES: ABC transporter ATP-binding protein [Halomonas]|uniref:ABC transporter ATP-binding protein n=1 Tax=Halomonas TaxID=2745 RepID=UPI001C9493D9|nr:MULTISPECIES: ABC transporter ATP-binding protein [Halomonas]MBY5927398.1 ABC transporter ATP-binding protein [Halomonas sp. DP4Y7-2]MBY5970640.1 ABC transporter ATP-binding protein [Halomonas denitrificans]MBY6234439.1 ABC transporter ATP-binding protein [Halomonas sp. DP4Y7-1]